LNELGAKYKEVDITQTPEMMHKIAQKSGFMTVPQIFVKSNGKEKCLGGYDEIHRMHQEGKLLAELGME